MKASTYIKSLGFTGGITRIAKMTGWDRRTLYRYYHEELERFEIIVLGCVSKEEGDEFITISDYLTQEAAKYKIVDKGERDET